MMVSTNSTILTLIGSDGRDTLTGTINDDILIGGLGGDTLTGGAGADQFVYESFSDRTDTITDFNPNQDMVVLTDVFAEIGYQGIDPIADGYLQFVQDNSNTRVQIDPDGADGFQTFRTMAILQNVAIESLAVGINVII
jgi:Ca2+-binding RTX toxin-like protein